MNSHTTLSQVAPFVLLHVEDVARSATFYGQMLGATPLEQSPGFAMLALGGGARLGLWKRAGVLPVSGGAPGASELAFPVTDGVQVDALHAAWIGQGLTVLQAPEDREFGRTSTVADPDGHRVRVFCPS